MSLIMDFLVWAKIKMNEKYLNRITFGNCIDQIPVLSEKKAPICLSKPVRLAEKRALAGILAGGGRLGPHILTSFIVSTCANIVV